MFQTDSKNKIWVGDITYIPTKKRTLYLADFLDIYSRKVVGWSMEKKVKDRLVVDAFIQAYGKEQQSSSKTPDFFKSWMLENHKL